MYSKGQLPVGRRAIGAAVAEIAWKPFKMLTATPDHGCSLKLAQITGFQSHVGVVRLGVELEKAHLLRVTQSNATSYNTVDT